MATKFVFPAKSGSRQSGSGFGCADDDRRVATLIDARPSKGLNSHRRPPDPGQRHVHPRVLRIGVIALARSRTTRARWQRSSPAQALGFLRLVGALGSQFDKSRNGAARVGDEIRHERNAAVMQVRARLFRDRAVRAFAYIRRADALDVVCSDDVLHGAGKQDVDRLIQNILGVSRRSSSLPWADRDFAASMSWFTSARCRSAESGSIERPGPAISADRPAPPGARPSR